MAKLFKFYYGGLSQILIALVYLFSVTSATLNATQILAELPKCALTCLITGIADSACSLSNLTCTCGDEVLQSKLSACVTDACPFSEQEQVVSINLELCAGIPVESRQRDVELPGIIFPAITVPIVVLRCYSRHQLSRNLWWDDWMIALAAVLLVAIVTLDIINCIKGFGKHVWDLDPHQVLSLEKIFLAAEVVYVAILATTKISILLFYFRVFQRRWFRHAVWTMIFLVAASAIAIMLVIIFQCNPINGAWDRTVENKKCLSVNAIAFSSAGMSIAQDVVILAMPVTQLIGLQMNLRKKLNVLGMFSVGAFATVTSMIRLKYLVFFGASKDPTWDNSAPSIWSLIEINTAIICACLPAIRAMLSQWLPSLFDITHKTSGINNSASSNRAQWNQDKVVSSGRTYSLNSALDMEADFEMDGVKRKADVNGDRRISKPPSINVKEIDAPSRFTGQNSPDTINPDTIEYDGRGSEEGLFITDMPTIVKDEQLRKGHVARQLKGRGT